MNNKAKLFKEYHLGNKIIKAFNDWEENLL